LLRNENGSPIVTRTEEYPLANNWKPPPKQVYKCADVSQRSSSGIHQRNMQISTLTNWVNHHLKASNLVVRDLFSDLTNGVKLLRLVEALTKANITNFVENPDGNVQKMQNVNTAIKFLQEKLGVQLSSISTPSVVAGNVKAIMDLIWQIIYVVEIKPSNYGGLEDRFALLSWCQDITNTYDGVSVNDFTKSFSDGLAFCALIHSHAPQLIDIEELESYKKMENLRKAFKVANQELGIPELLLFQDFKEEPDETSIIVYLVQFFRKFSA